MIRGILGLRYILFILLLCLVGCKSVKISRTFELNFKTTSGDKHFTGLLVYNPESGDTIISHNANQYFTPASNVKIFTLYSALQVLPKKIPAFKYEVEQDTITIQGVGNPTFLDPYFKDSTALNYTRNYHKVNLLVDNLKDSKYAPGWAWEDFDAYYSAERTSFPMYGNVLSISSRDNLVCTPNILISEIEIGLNSWKREQSKNKFHFDPKVRDSIIIPMVMEPLLVSKLWNELEPNKVFISESSSKKLNQIAYTGIPSDSLYRRMMVESDNFLAEQLLILASSTLSDTLDTKKLRAFMLDNYLNDLAQAPRWVDGSGLSRYNLFTPNSIVHVLTKMLNEVPKKRLLQLFPVGGESGTLKQWFIGSNKPYVFAKSGSLSNNYCLSGYLITNAGNTLVFSFMNNHYMRSSSELKKEMQLVLETLRDYY